MASWVIDPDHSCASFSIRHMALAHVRGLFSSVKGAIQYDPDKRSGAAVDVAIDVNSVSTGVRVRDEHLSTADFFNQQQYPQILFKSTSVEFTGKERCRVTGQLTLHGVTRTVTFEGEYAGPHGNPYGDEISIGFSGSATLNREDFGMMWGSEPMAGGGLVAGKQVQVSLDVEADMVK